MDVSLVISIVEPFNLVQMGAHNAEVFKYGKHLWEPTILKFLNMGNTYGLHDSVKRIYFATYHSSGLAILKSYLYAFCKHKPSLFVKNYRDDPCTDRYVNISSHNPYHSGFWTLGYEGFDMNLFKLFEFCYKNPGACPMYDVRCFLGCLTDSYVQESR